MITIDGSQGEGGGQVLRSSVAMALVTGTPLRIENIRARRPKPGLRRQHLTAVQAAARIGQADVEDAEIGSARLTFKPRDILPGEYRFAVGSAGSTTLVLQTVLPALLTARGPSTLVLEGGTHNPMAPPFDFLEKSFLPIINRMGPRVSATLERPGFYPAGGGSFTITIQPAPRLEPLHLLDRGKILRCKATATVSRLPRHIAERELRVLGRKLGWDEACMAVDEVADPRGPGNVVTLEIECEHVTEVFTAFGMRGVPAESVASTAARAAEQYLASNVPVGEHLADQLLLPLVLAGGGSFRTQPLSAHARTNIDVLRSFSKVSISVEDLGGRTRLVSLAP